MKTTIYILIASLLTACAGATYRPLVDRPGPDYEIDLKECQAHAEKELDAGKGAVAGMVLGVILGALLGAAVGHNSGFQSDFVAAGAVGGGVGGAMSGGVGAENNQISIIQRCMAGRGYSVLR